MKNSHPNHRIRTSYWWTDISEQIMSHGRMLKDHQR